MWQTPLPSRWTSAKGESALSASAVAVRRPVIYAAVFAAYAAGMPFCCCEDQRGAAMLRPTRLLRSVATLLAFIAGTFLPLFVTTAARTVPFYSSAAAFSPPVFSMATTRVCDRVLFRQAGGVGTHFLPRPGVGWSRASSSRSRSS